MIKLIQTCYFYIALCNYNLIELHHNSTLAWTSFLLQDPTGKKWTGVITNKEGKKGICQFSSQKTVIYTLCEYRWKMQFKRYILNFHGKWGHVIEVKCDVYVKANHCFLFLFFPVFLFFRIFYFFFIRLITHCLKCKCKALWHDEAKYYQ